MTAQAAALTTEVTSVPDRYREATIRDQVWLFWCIPGFFAVFGLVFVVLARVMPPPAPGKSSAEIIEFFQTHGFTIQIGFVILIIVTGLFNILNGLMTVHLKRTTHGKTFAYAFLFAQTVGVTPGLLLPGVAMLAGALRPERSPELLVTLYDMTFLTFVGSLGCFVTAYIPLIAAILLDKNKIFPRWFAYVSIWNLVTEFVAVPVFFFRDGAFAWDGAISFWVDTAVFVVWQNAILIQLFRTINRQPPGMAYPD
ncbi:hypothetical protein [Zhongshania sp.]|uniref:hypothetical protein n=2 Tax=Zhongshania sp. TaxID=1971902 RepID=UPI003565005F